MPLLDTYNRDNLNIVAWIWDYDPDNAANCSVANVVQIPWSGITAGVKAVVADNAAAEYYTLDGQRINANRMQGGVYIVRSAGVSRKVVLK